MPFFVSAPPTRLAKSSEYTYNETIIDNWVSYMTIGNFPHTRMRRSRRYDWSRRLVAEHALSANDLIWPVFVQEGKKLATDISAMPGVQRLSVDLLLKKVEKAASLGIPAIALFPVIDSDKKTPLAEEAYNPDNLICRTIREIKHAVPEIGIIGDVALDPYTSHGQDGVVIDDYVANDETVEILQKQAVTLAEAGCDIVAPSDMMDGRVAAVRGALEQSGHTNVQLLSYAVKYASSFYGPFREAVGSVHNLAGAGKQTYQMNPANLDEALHEALLDVQEGADMLMVKPGMPYLDVIRAVKEHTPLPVLAYQVSGEYAMIKAASAQGWLNEMDVMLESLLAFKRAGACAILTYAAIEVARQLSKGK